MGFTAGRVHYAPQRERPKARSSRKRDPRRLGASPGPRCPVGAGERQRVQTWPWGVWRTPHRLLLVPGPAFSALRFWPPPLLAPRSWPPAPGSMSRPLCTAQHRLGTQSHRGTGAPIGRHCPGEGLPFTSRALWRPPDAGAVVGGCALEHGEGAIVAGEGRAKSATDRAAERPSEVCSQSAREPRPPLVAGSYSEGALKP